MRLIGVFLSCEAPVGTTTVAAASSRALESAPAVTTELSVCRGLDALGEGPLICSTWGRSVLAVLCPPGLCLSPGERRILDCVRRHPVLPACAVGFALPAAQPLLRGASAVAASELLLGAVETPRCSSCLRAAPLDEQPPAPGAST